MRTATFATRDSGRRRGQALVEFAVVVPILMLVLGAIVQFGIILWGQNTLTHIANDTARWAASQQDCSSTAPIVAKANAIAAQSSLIGFANDWTSANVAVSWQTTPTTDPCPPTSNQQTSSVTITITHHVPVFFPLLPGNGNLSSTTQFRMEPATSP